MAGRPPFDLFDAESEDIKSYLERLQEYFTAYDMADNLDNAAKRRAILLTSIGSNCFRILKDLAFPNAPNTKTFEQLATLLREHFKPTRSKITERSRFHSVVQQQGQISLNPVTQTLTRKLTQGNHLLSRLFLVPRNLLRDGHVDFPLGHSDCK